MNEKNDNLNETQPSGGFGGEGSGSEAVELSPQAETNGRSLSRHVSRETKNKPSSFYVYLAVLFGAAFLMLLLAYFVQRRNSETVQDNLRTTIASREELLEDIQRLEEENLALMERNEDLSVQLDGLQEEIDDLFKQVVNEHHAYIDCYDRLEVLQQFALLEQALRDKNYEIAVTRVRVLCSGVLELYSYSYELPGEPPFDSRARLAEIILLLEKAGALTPGEVAVPGAAASDG